MKSNLYYNYAYDEQLLNRTVGELRKELQIGDPQKNELFDYVYFICWVLLFFAEIFLIGVLICMVCSKIK